MTETIVVPATATVPMSSAWRQCVGTGRLNLALRADYQESLARVQREIGFAHIRGHGLLSDDMGVLRTDEVDGRSHQRTRSRTRTRCTTGSWRSASGRSSSSGSCPTHSHRVTRRSSGGREM